MDTSNITTTTLRNLLKLTEKRDALMAELKNLEATIAGVAGQKASPGAPAKAARKTRKVRRTRKVGRPAKKTATSKAVKAVKAKAPARKKSGRHGALKVRILKALHEAGAKGVAVKDLSKQLGVKSQNVHVWFSSTGKKLKEIKKIAPGKYRIKSGS